MSTPLVRRARPGDEDALALIGSATFLETFADVLDGDAVVAHCGAAHAAAYYGGHLASATSAAWLACAQSTGAPVGYALVGTPDLPTANPTRDIELKRIYLLGRFQGTGTGRRLMEAAIDFARDQGAQRLLLGVYAGNIAAIAFYRHLGYQPVAERTFNVGGKGYADQVMALPLS